MPSGRSVLFVYNADSGIMSAMKDPVSRMAGSGSGRCNLHAITFSPIGMKKEWRRFVNGLGIPVRFLSRNEFVSEFRTVSTTFPVAFLQTAAGPVPFIGTDEINRCAGLEDLISLVQQRLSEFPT